MGAIAGHLHTLYEKSFAWYKILHNAINRMDRKEEVLLRFTCTSVYAHVSMAIQHVLKADDMVVYQILKRHSAKSAILNRKENGRER